MPSSTTRKLNKPVRERTLPRIPLPAPEEMNPEQRRVYEAIVGGPRGRLVGPLRAALHRPELADKWQQFGELLRYRTALPPKLSELAILVTARHTRSNLEWIVHEQMAIKAELPLAIIADIFAQRRPADADADMLIIHDYAFELNENNTVSDDVHRRVTERFGVVAVVELTALVGYYTMVAMTLNAHQIPLPDGTTPVFN
jgi:4-carboxymuconolactone decarboxylase